MAKFAPPIWAIHKETRRPAHNTLIHVDFLYGSLYKTQKIHVDRRVVGWSAGLHVDRPCGGQISPWPARKVTGGGVGRGQGGKLSKMLFFMGNVMTIKFWKWKFYCREILLSWRRLLCRGLQITFWNSVVETSKLVSTKTLLLKHYYRHQGAIFSQNDKSAGVATLTFLQRGQGKIIHVRKIPPMLRVAPSSIGDKIIWK